MSKIYTCILIDDELLALSYLRTLCEEIPTIKVVKAYDNPVLLLEDLAGLKVDFCISDIVMPSISGLELAQQLNGIPVIFTTAHNEYAADAFDIDAIDYLRKPVQKQRLEKAIEKVIQFIENNDEKPVQIPVTTNKGKMLLSSDQVVSISSETLDRRDKSALLKSGEEWLLKNTSFDQLMNQLPASSFCRISKSEVISMDIVIGHTHDTVLTSLKDKTGKSKSIVIGENYRKAFLEKLKK